MFPALEIVTPVEPYPPPTFRVSIFAVAKAALIAVAFGRESVALFIVAVPDDAPRFNVVAAPKALTVVAEVLNTVAVPFVVVRSPPFAAMSPAVTFPEAPATEKFVPVMLFAPKAMALTISASERSNAFVIRPFSD